jgi:hypothetical protein
MAHFIKLQRYGMTDVLQERLQGYRIRVVVTEAIGVNPNIFVFQRRPLTVADTYDDRFENIASPADLEEYPVGAPADLNRPFYRLSEIDLVFRSVSNVEEAWNILLAEVADLIYTLDQMEALQLQNEVSFGLSSSSSSSSA